MARATIDAAGIEEWKFDLDVLGLEKEDAGEDPPSEVVPDAELTAPVTD